MNPTPNQSLSLYLHHAVLQNNVYAVRYYLDCGASVSDHNAEGKSAISVAVNLRKREVLSVLLSYCHVNVWDPDTGLSYCHIASMLDDRDAVGRFLHNGATVNHRVGTIGKAIRNLENWQGWPVLTDPHFTGEPSLRRGPANDKWANYTSLHFATENSAKSVMKLLIISRANVNVEDARGNTPLHLACALEEPDDIVRILLSTGANPNVHNMKGVMPVHVAIDRQNLDVLKILVAYGAELDRPMWGVFNLTCLHLACKNAEVTQFVIQQKVNVNAADLSGGTALHALVGVMPNSGVDYKKVLNILHEAGVDLNHRDHLGQTALHRAISHTHTIMTRLLLEQGASIAVLDHFGRSAIWYVLQSHCHDMRHAIDDYMDKMQLISPCTNYKYMICPERHNLIARCKAELAKMGEHCVDERTTLYDIVSHKSWTFASNHVNNQELCDFVNGERCDQDYPLYAYFIRQRFRYNRRRFQLIERAKEPFNSLLNIQLPYEVMDVLFKMLSAQDLKKIIEARRQQVVETYESKFDKEIRQKKLIKWNRSNRYDSQNQQFLENEQDQLI